jgi:hypothetical protein
VREWVSTHEPLCVNQGVRTIALSWMLWMGGGVCMDFEKHSTQRKCILAAWQFLSVKKALQHCMKRRAAKPVALRVIA